MSLLLLFALLPVLAMGMFETGVSDGEADPKPAAIDGSDDGDNLTGTALDDQIEANGGNDYVSGLDGDDHMSLGNGNDHGAGGRGNDTILGGAGNDVLEGGAGNDSAHGGAGNDILFDDTGVDTLYGDLGHDAIDGRDDPLGQAGSGDHLYGGEGFDTLIGDAGDTMSGGAWHDEFYVTAGGTPVVISDWEDGEPVTISVPVGARDAVLSTRNSEDGFDLEVVYNDQVVAVLSGQANVDFLPHLVVEAFLPEELIGTEGNDVLLGGAGNDMLVGYGGDDHIDADGGDDTAYGGAGNDFVHLGNGNDYFADIWPEHGADPALTDLDEVHAGGGNDTLIGDGGKDLLFGDSGNDYLSARDTLAGHEATSDEVMGGIGHDTLIGDYGDTLTGGSGMDSFQIFAPAAASDAPVVIEDFNPLYDSISLQLAATPDLPAPAGQISYEVDATNDRVVVSIDGFQRLILNNTQTFDPRWITLSVA